MSLIQTYNDGEGVTTVAWLDADFNPVKAGSDDAVYVKMIASTGEMSFFRVEQDRKLEFNPDQPRDEDGKWTGGSSDRSAAHLTKGKVHGRERILGSVNHVERISLVEEGKHPVNDAVEAIFKPVSGESWTAADVTSKEQEAMRERYPTEEFEQMLDDGEFGGDGDPDEPVRETITNRDFSYADREAAAYELDEALGLGVVPPTIVREIDGKRGMVQQYIETGTGLGAGDSGIDQDSVYGLAILDIATGNTDRHAGNVLIDNDRRAVAIDQGLSFPDDSQWHDNYQFRPDATISLLAANQGSMSAEMSSRITEKLKNIDWKQLSSKWPMTEGERSGFLKRIERLKDVFVDEEYGNPSQGVRGLIIDMARESNIASTYELDAAKRVKTEISR